MRLFKNTRYYRWLDESTMEEVRLVRIQNQNIGTVLVTKGPNFGEKRKVSFKELSDRYAKLIPDGYITFNIVTIGQDLKDVMVLVNRRKDTAAGSGLPYAVCRQCVIDLFAKQLSPDNVDYTGISISQDTCPSDVKFENYLACENVIKNETIAFYIGDKLDNILNVLKYTKHYDQVLVDLNESHCMYLANNNDLIARVYKERDEVDGYCKSLKSLLYLNNFEYDLQTAFGIVPLDLPFEGAMDSIAVQDVTGNYTLNTVAKSILSSVLLIDIDKSLIVKYDKDIDLDAIKRRYCLVSDRDKDVYLVAYTSAGKFHPDIDGVESEENMEKLMKYLPSESVRLAFSHLQFRKEKYNK